jgi:hypothetical protein
MTNGPKKTASPAAHSTAVASGKASGLPSIAKLKEADGTPTCSRTPAAWLPRTKRMQPFA